MQNISEIIGKIAITLSDAQQAGTILDVYFDEQLSKCRGFSLIGENDEVFWTDIKNVQKTGFDAVVLKSACDITAFPPPQDYCKSPINLPAYNQDGVFLGIIKDISLDGERVHSFLSDKELLSSILLCCSSTAAVFNESGTVIKIKKSVRTMAQKPKKAFEGEKGSFFNIKNNALDKNANNINPAKTDLPQENSQGVSPAKDDNVEISLPYKVPLANITLLPNSVINEEVQNKYGFLTGKVLTRTIYSASGRIIAKENEVVSPDIIALAKSEGKLMSLALHSL